MTAPDRRRQALTRLSNETFDVLIVGGGITGCGIARDAVMRGLRVALVEKLDFAGGTSSKSSKLVHGGLRYLEQAEFKLVFESVNERNLLTHLARHLVRPTPFLVTNFAGDRRWLLTMDFGLWIYEALCFFRGYKNHRTYGARRTLELEPHLRQEGLNGGILYYDCVTDDARLTLENAIDAQARGAVMLNHCRAGSLLKSNGRVSGVQVHDELSGQGPIDVRARVVVNATGPWTDELRALANEEPLLKPTKGVHIVVDAQRMPVKNALMVASPRDKRAVFCIPWGLGRSVIGTTDTFFDGKADDVHADAADVEYLLETGNHYFPHSKLTQADVLSTWAGLRPLLKPPDAATGASQVSREHLLDVREGLITIAGGKLTTYRRMAAEVVEHALLQLGKKAPCTTGEHPLPGSNGLASDEQLRALEHAVGMAPEVNQALVNLYGSRAPGIAARVKGDPTAGERIDPELPYVNAQIDEAVENELAFTLDDMLSRRVPLELRGRDQGLGAAEAVARRMGKRLEWDEPRIARELSAYRAVVANSRRFKTP